MTTTRNEMVTKLKAGLDRCNTEIDELEETVKQQKAMVDQEFGERIASLKQKRDEAKQRLREILGVTENAEQSLQSGTKEIWGEIKHTLKESKDAFFEGLDEDEGKKP
ncbi:MAG: hypothetical protein O3C43_22600 [Verrucomicrobia bacterium]|nr:hypothetical protein [Verrucomicrobiota bacterium]MDA1069282.1 hypothetical protein [Verrucomicrobiota bacterium]